MQSWLLRAESRIRNWTSRNFAAFCLEGRGTEFCGSRRQLENRRIKLCVGLRVLVCVCWFACVGLRVLVCVCWSGGVGRCLGLAAGVPVARECLLLGFAVLVIWLQLGVQLDDGMLQQIEADRPSTQRIVAAIAKAGHVRCQAESCDRRVGLFTMERRFQLNVATLSRWRYTAFHQWFCLSNVLSFPMAVPLQIAVSCPMVLSCSMILS